MKEVLTPLAQPEYAALPSASQEQRSFVVVSGKLYWSDGTQWYQVAPPQSGSGGTTRDELEVSYGYVYI